MAAKMTVTIDDMMKWFWFEENPQHYPSQSKPVEWPAPGLELRMDGIWVQTPDDRTIEMLAPSEFRLLYRAHPLNDLSKPALQLPCTGAELVAFLEWAEVADDYLSDDSDFNPVPLDIRKALLAESAIAKGEPAPKETREKWEIPDRWEYKARRIGTQYLEDERDKGRTDIGIPEIAQHVAAEFRSQGHRSKRTKGFLDWDTIKSEALTGITGRFANGKSPKN